MTNTENIIFIAYAMQNIVPTIRNAAKNLSNRLATDILSTRNGCFRSPEGSLSQP